MRTIEHANARAEALVEAVLAELRAGHAAARRLGVGIVQRGPDGGWHPAARWQGSQEQTDAASRRLRLQLEARSLPAPTDADRARRLRVVEAEVPPINPPALGRRETPFWLGFERPR